VSLAATASDNVGVQSVQFFLDGSTSLGVDTTAPYLGEWNSTTASNGSHVLTAMARDAAGNQTTSSGVPVTTTNPGFVNEVVVPGITAATTMAFLPGGRMLVGELTETIWVVQPGASQPDPTPFLQLDGRLLVDGAGTAGHPRRSELCPERLVLRLLHTGHQFGQPQQGLAVHGKRQRDGSRQRGAALGG
jgi:hypothetical protein